MSRLRQSNGDDYPEAAGKHLTDASVLMTGGRYDGTAYLAGYVAECALKALIQMETGQGLRSHDLLDLRTTLGTIASQAGPQTQRLYVSATAVLNGSNILNWKPGLRYQAAQVTTATAREWLQDATSIYSRIIGGLRLNGTL
jgi:HEPN domain-containing protein